MQDETLPPGKAGGRGATPRLETARSYVAGLFADSEPFRPPRADLLDGLAERLRQIPAATCYLREITASLASIHGPKIGAQVTLDLIDGTVFAVPRECRTDGTRWR